MYLFLTLTFMNLQLVKEWMKKISTICELLSSATTGILNFSVRAKTYGKIRIPSEKYFSDGVPSEKYPQKYNDRKIEFFCRFTVRNNFSVGLTRTEKLCSPRLKLIFPCVNPHRKKRNKRTEKKN